MRVKTEGASRNTALIKIVVAGDVKSSFLPTPAQYIHPMVPSFRFTSGWKSITKVASSLWFNATVNLW